MYVYYIPRECELSFGGCWDSTGPVRNTVYAPSITAGTVEFVARHAENPFDMQPPCGQFVPGYGATTADFHVVGDHPGVHGGLETGVPFTDMAWSERFFDTLEAGGLIGTDDDEIVSTNTFFSYLHMCLPETESPERTSYGEMEPYFDSELRAITAHVLFPVGPRATEHVFKTCSAIDPARASEMDAIHARDMRGSGWLIMPVKDPAEWTDNDEAALVAAIQELIESDYEQLSDLGRFLPDDDPYFVR